MEVCNPPQPEEPLRSSPGSTDPCLKLLIHPQKQQDIVQLYLWIHNNAVPDTQTQRAAAGQPGGSNEQ